LGETENDIVVDLNGLELDGEVLDMGFNGRGIMFRALKRQTKDEAFIEAAITSEPSTDREDFNWVYGYPSELPFCDNCFDAVVLFFSLSCLNRKYIRNKTIKEIARILKNRGRLYIWDININTFSIYSRKTIEAILPRGECVRFKVNMAGFPGSFHFDIVLPVVAKYLSINEKKNYGKYFYIEAVKRDDNIENSSCSA